MHELSIDDLEHVAGGAGATSWNEIRAAAAPHCPETVASHPHAPANRAEAQRIGDACIAEMGSFKAGFGGGRAKIQAGIDRVFPR